jgi:hypothetical protein
VDLTAYLHNNSSCSVKTEVIFGNIFEGKKHLIRWKTWYTLQVVPLIWNYKVVKDTYSLQMFDMTNLQ